MSSLTLEKFFIRMGKPIIRKLCDMPLIWVSRLAHWCKYWELAQKTYTNLHLQFLYVKYSEYIFMLSFNEYYMSIRKMSTTPLK